jgi:hypothetical protein
VVARGSPVARWWPSGGPVVARWWPRGSPVVVWWCSGDPVVAQWWPGGSPVMARWWSGGVPVARWWPGGGPVVARWWLGGGPVVFRWPGGGPADATSRFDIGTTSIRMDTLGCPPEFQGKPQNRATALLHKKDTCSRSQKNSVCMSCNPRGELETRPREARPKFLVYI